MKVGDRVKMVEDSIGAPKGAMGTVLDIFDEDGFYIDWDRGEWVDGPYHEDELEMIEQSENNIHAPVHYNANGNLECIDAIREALTKEEFKGMLAGNVMKYLWRREYKGKPLEDVKKARWYLDQLIKEYEDDD